MFIHKCYLVVSEITVPTLKICIDNGVVSLENWTVQLQCLVHLDCTIKSEIRLWTGGYGQVFENIFLNNFVGGSYCSFPVWVRKENTFFLCTIMTHLQSTCHCIKGVILWTCWYIIIYYLCNKQWSGIIWLMIIFYAEYIKSIKKNWITNC